MCNSVNSYIQEQTRLMHIAHRKKRLHMETPNGRLKAVVKKKIEEKRCTREIIHKKNYQCTLCKVRQLNPLRITSSCGIYSVLNKRTVLNSHYTICSKAASPFFFKLVFVTCYIFQNGDHRLPSVEHRPEFKISN